MLDQERIFSVLELLNLLNESNKIARKLLQSYFRSKKYICSKDRKFISNSFWNILRHRNKIDWHLEYLNIELRRLRSKTFRKYLENYNRALSSRDAEKYVDGENDVVDMDKIINDFALIRNQWLGITKGLDQKQWQITNIVKLRVAGMEDADIK